MGLNFLSPLGAHGAVISLVQKPNTGGSQFFLTTVPTPWLDGAHAIFGEVSDGMNIVKNIENCKTGHMDRPNKPQRIISVSRTDGASQKDEEYQKWKEGK